MSNVIADISNYQFISANNDYNWQKTLKNKYGVKSVCILTSEGTSWKQPYAAYQASNAYKLFGNFSCYHFFEGSGKAEAINFIQSLNNIGADKSTVVMIDCETRVADLTSHINAFIDYVWDKGFHNIYVYGMETMFNNTEIIISRLHHKPKIWVANISYKPSIKCDAWQYTWTGNVQGTNVDLDVDYSNLLSKGVTASKPHPSYYTNGKVFIVKTDGLRIYQKINLDKKKQTYNFYKKGTHFDVEEVVPYGRAYRLKTKYGYATANKDFVEKYK